MRLIRKARTFLYIFARKPATAWELLQIRAEGKFGIPLHMLSGRRRATWRFEKRRTHPMSPNLVAYGNYYLDPSRLGEAPVIFSLGVGQFIDFDLALLERHNPRLFLFDPTPASKRFIDQANLPPNAEFQQIAVADHDGELEMFTDDLESELETTSSVSMFNRGFTQSGFTVACRRMPTLMAERGIETLDVLKLDIEGAAIKVLNDTLDQGIYPTQIAAEFERPETRAEMADFFRDLDALFTRLEELGYTIYRTRPDMKGFQIEIIAVRAPGRPDGERAPALAAAAQ